MKKLIAVALMMMLCSPALAIDYTWFGGTGDYHDAGTNWAPAGPPGTGDRFIATAGTINVSQAQLDTARSDLTNTTLNIQNGGELRSTNLYWGNGGSFQGLRRWPGLRARLEGECRHTQLRRQRQRSHAQRHDWRHHPCDW